MPAKPTRLTLARQWELLKLLPSAGAGKTSGELTRDIAELGFAVSKRQVERDLNELRAAFAIEANDASIPWGWRWQKNASVDMPGLTLAEALSLHMVKDVLKTQLPAAMLQALEPRFAQAEAKLRGLAPDSNVANWPNRVRSVPTSLPFLPPSIAANVLTDVQDALLTREQLEVDYRPMEADAPRTLCLHPLALVNRGPVTYLVATAWDYTDIRLYALHRITRTQRLYEPCQSPKDFDVDQYIATGALQFGCGQTLQLKAQVSGDLARILSETPLSADQTLRNGLLTATVPDAWQLDWWLLSQGDAILVTEPKPLRDRMVASLRSTLAQYETGDGMAAEIPTTPPVST